MTLGYNDCLEEKNWYNNNNNELLIYIFITFNNKQKKIKTKFRKIKGKAEQQEEIKMIKKHSQQVLK